MKLGIVISTNDAEATWNAFRLANFSKKQGDEVRVFLVAKAVEYEKLSTEKYPAREEATKFIGSGGCILACGTCLKSREQEGTKFCPLSSLKDLYAIVRESDRVVCF